MLKNQKNLFGTIIDAIIDALKVGVTWSLYTSGLKGLTSLFGMIRYWICLNKGF